MKEDQLSASHEQREVLAVAQLVVNILFFPYTWWVGELSMLHSGGKWCWVAKVFLQPRQQVRGGVGGKVEGTELLHACSVALTVFQYG